MVPPRHSSAGTKRVRWTWCSLMSLLALVQRCTQLQWVVDPAMRIGNALLAFYALCSIAIPQEKFLTCAQPSICSGISSSSLDSMQIPISKPRSAAASHSEAIDFRATKFHCSENTCGSGASRKNVVCGSDLRVHAERCSRSPCSCCLLLLLALCRLTHLTKHSAAPACHCIREA